MKLTMYMDAAASVLLRCVSKVIKFNTPLRPLAHERNSFFKYKLNTIHDPRGPKNTKLCIKGLHLRLVQYNIHQTFCNELLLKMIYLG